MTAFEINKDEFSRVLPDIKINEFIQKPVSIKDLVKSVQGHIITNTNLEYRMN